jgi:hypothetical protein
MMTPKPKGFHMSAHFSVSAAALPNEAPGFSSARNGKGTLAVWGLVLGSLLFGVTMVAAVTVSTWAQAASVY